MTFRETINQILIDSYGKNAEGRKIAVDRLEELIKAIANADLIKTMEKQK